MGTYRETPRHVPFFPAPPCALGVRQKAQAFRAPGSLKQKILRPFGAQNDREAGAQNDRGAGAQNDTGGQPQ